MSTPRRLATARATERTVQYAGGCLRTIHLPFVRENNFPAPTWRVDRQGFFKCVLDILNTTERSGEEHRVGWVCVCVWGGSSRIKWLFKQESKVEPALMTVW